MLRHCVWLLTNTAEIAYCVQATGAVELA